MELKQSFFMDWEPVKSYSYVVGSKVLGLMDIFGERWELSIQQWSFLYGAWDSYIFICGIGRGMDIKLSRFMDDAKLFWEIKCFANDKWLQKNLATLSGEKGSLGA